MCSSDLEGIGLYILTKKPGHATLLEPSFMEFGYKHQSQSHYLPDPYERLLMDAIRGDQTFFNDAEEVEAQWAFIDPLVAQRKNPTIYKSDSLGPKEADQLLEVDGRQWLDLT